LVYSLEGNRSPICSPSLLLLLPSSHLKLILSCCSPYLVATWFSARMSFPYLVHWFFPPAPVFLLCNCSPVLAWPYPSPGLLLFLVWLWFCTYHFGLWGLFLAHFWITT
jgi:hypothetical protein